MIDYTKVDAVMVGRAALGRPWLISQIHNYLDSGELAQDVELSVIRDTLLKHIEGLRLYYGDRLALGLSRKYVCWYCKNLRDARKFRERYVRIDNANEALNEIKAFFDKCETDAKEEGL